MNLSASRARRCVVIDYGMGNIWSVQSAVNYLGVSCEVVSEPDHLEGASHVILPGVGSFRVAMETLRARGMVDSVVDWVKKGNGCLLGICLGMQLLARESDEDGVTEGFGFLYQRVEHFRRDLDHRLRIPHVGFNSLTFEEPEGIFCGLESGSDFYFVHSYRISDQASGGRRGYTTYGEQFLGAIELENLWGVQFHPEKSQSNGLRLLSNFLETNLHAC